MGNSTYWRTWIINFQCSKDMPQALSWKKWKQYHKDKFLSKPDLGSLSQYISDKCEENAFSRNIFLAEALYIKKKRQIAAINFLIAIRLPK